MRKEFIKVYYLPAGFELGDRDKWQVILVHPKSGAEKMRIIRRDEGRKSDIYISVEHIKDNSVIPTVFLKREYQYIAYVGLSGGATTGLYTCNATSNLIQDCFLIAGVMPYKYRLTPKSFGDSEQISASFYKKYQVMPLLKEIKGQNVYLFYNDRDPCCFDSVNASLFAKDIFGENLKNVNITIRESSLHDFDPLVLQKIMDKHSK